MSELKSLDQVPPLNKNREFEVWIQDTGTLENLKEMHSLIGKYSVNGVSLSQTTYVLIESFLFHNFMRRSQEYGIDIKFAKRKGYLPCAKEKRIFYEDRPSEHIDCIHPVFYGLGRYIVESLPQHPRGSLEFGKTHEEVIVSLLKRGIEADKEKRSFK